MAAYSVDTHDNSSGSGSSDQTRANKVKFTRPVIVTGLQLGFGAAGSATAAPRIYNASGTLVASGTGGAVSAGSKGLSSVLNLTAPVRLEPYQSYYIGFWLSGAWSGVSLPASPGVDHVHSSTRAGVDLIHEGLGTSLSDSAPSNDPTAEMWTRILFNVDETAWRRGLNAIQIGRGRRGIFFP